MMASIKNDLYMPTFLKTTYEERTERSETSAYKIHMPGNHPKEWIQQSVHAESLKSRTLTFFTNSATVSLPKTLHCVIYVSFRIQGDLPPPHGNSGTESSGRFTVNAIWHFSITRKVRNMSFHREWWLMMHATELVLLIQYSSQSFSISGSAEHVSA